MRIADRARVPGGHALTVDPEVFAAEVTLAAEKADVNEFTLRDARQLLKVESYRNKGPHPQPYWWKLPGSLTPEGASVETNI